MPDSVATFLRILTAGAAVAALFLTKSENRWLDGPRLVLILVALYYLPSVFRRSGLLTSASPSLPGLLAFGLGITFDYLRHRLLIPLAVAVAGLIWWNLQLGYIYNAELVSQRDEAATLDRVAAAQMDVLYRRLLRSHEWMPRTLWVLLYDNLKGVWMDEGSRSFNGRIDLRNEPEGYFPLVGDGWFPPEEKDGTTYRLSRGRRSWLTLPIRRPADSSIVVRARLERPEVQARMAVAVNGETIGEEELRHGWSEHVFAVPKHLLHSGLNQIILTYSATPRAVIPGFHGRNATAAVDWIEFRRLKGPIR